MVVSVRLLMGSWLCASHVRTATEQTHPLQPRAQPTLTLS